LRKYYIVPKPVVNNFPIWKIFLLKCGKDKLFISKITSKINLKATMNNQYLNLIFYKKKDKVIHNLFIISIIFSYFNGRLAPLLLNLLLI